MDMAEIPTKDGGQQKGNDSQGAYGDETQGPVKEFMKDNASKGTFERQCL